MVLAYGFYAAAAAAAVLLVLLLRSGQRGRAAAAIADQKTASVADQLAIVRQERDTYLAEKIALGNRVADMAARNEGWQQKLQEQEGELKRLQDYFRKEFELVAGRLLEEKSEKFTRQNQLNLEHILKPLHERIKEFEKKVEDSYSQEAKERFSLQKELNRMYELNQTLSEQANNLTRALKTDTKKQGNWGEFLLERILEVCGLEDGIHYKRQLSVTAPAGNTLRPDVVVLLPENRHVVIDAKMSLTAYEKYCSCADEPSRAQALREHLRSVRSHIDELSQKKYESLFEESPDFVLMFIPLEPAYALALAEDNDLFTAAFRKKVILVSISSLLATLRIIDSMWRLEKQNRNAAEIIRQGSALYDKFAGFVEDMQALGQKLDGARQEYEQAFGKLSTGRGNLVRRAEQMKALGLDTRKQLPALLTGDEEETG